MYKDKVQGASSVLFMQKTGFSYLRDVPSRGAESQGMGQGDIVLSPRRGAVCCLSCLTAR